MIQLDSTPSGVVGLSLSRYLGAGDPGAAFTACAAQCIASRTRMLLPPGTLTFATAGVIPSCAGLQVVGHGRDATVLRADAGLNDFVIRFDSTAGPITGGVFTDFSVDGNQGLQASGGCIWARGAVQCSFERLHVKYPYDVGLRLDGIQAGGFGHHNRVERSLFDGGTSSPGEGIGLRLFATDENTITACDFEDLGGVGAEVGAIIDQSGLNTFMGCVVVNGKDGLRVKDTGRVRWIGGTFDGCFETSIIISGDLCNISDVTFLEGKAGKSYIWTNNGADNIIKGNTFRTPAAAMRSLVRESGGANNNTVALNRGKYDPTAVTVAAYEQEFPGTGIWVHNTAS